MRDTSPEAAAQEEIYRRMTPGERTRVAFEMSEATRQKALADIRSRQSEMSERQLIRELVRLW